jgi:hypothetical protein
MDRMIEGLEKLLDGRGERGLDELRGLLEELFVEPNGAARLLGDEALGARKKPVFRLRFDINGRTRSVVIKRLKPEVARRTELVVKRWLPAIALDRGAMPLLGSVAAHNGLRTWHIYEDLGAHELDPVHPDRERVRAAIELIAQLHTRFAGHPLLGEVRTHGGDFGMRFYEANVRDAIHALEAVPPSPPHQALRDRLLGRLYRLRDETPMRAAALASLGLPETLVHGDLWSINVFVTPTDNGLEPCLIDWDHAGVGPFTYDLSTLLVRFPAPHRAWMLELYRQAVAQAGWQLPPLDILNLIFETHEFARYAQSIIWPAIDIVVDGGVWGFDALEEVDGWFETFDACSDWQDAVQASRPGLVHTSMIAPDRDGPPNNS